VVVRPAFLQDRDNGRARRVRLFGAGTFGVEEGRPADDIEFMQVADSVHVTARIK
jgi:hypothetical protein